MGCHKDVDFHRWEKRFKNLHSFLQSDVDREQVENLLGVPVPIKLAGDTLLPLKEVNTDVGIGGEGNTELGAGRTDPKSTILWPGGGVQRDSAGAGTDGGGADATDRLGEIACSSHFSQPIKTPSQIRNIYLSSSL